MKKYKIGYTTGVFDMFHIGHLNILKRAKEQCEYLIVGVNADELVETYKKKRPIIKCEDRMEIVKAIKYVDEVVFQEHRDKMAQYHHYKFDVMFLGDDWKDSELFLAVKKELESFGSNLVFLPYTQEVSSTILREKIK